MRFNQIPLNIRTVGSFVEFDASRARRGLPVKTPRVLLIGGKLAAGTAAAGAVVPILSADAAKASFGVGSVLAQMAGAFLAANTSAEVFGIALSDNGAGVAAQGTITITGPATAAGTLKVYIGGRVVTVGVPSGRTATQVATDLAAAVNAITELPVTAGSAAGVVTLTARHKGETGNGIDVRTNYYREDALPAGIGVAIAAMAGGVTDPAVSDAVTAMADEPFDVIATAYTTTANLAALEAELASRWGPDRMLDGVAFCAIRGTQGGLATIGAARNSPHLSILGVDGMPGLPWVWAATKAAVIAHYGGIDPARPFQTLPLPGLLAPAEADRFTRAERELLLNDGISTFVVTPSGEVQLERPITTYQLNAAGAADTAFLDVNTMLTLAYLRWSLRAWIASKFPRHKLVSDGVPVAAGSATVSPKIIRSEVIAWFKAAEDAGLVENMEQFKQDLVVERDGSDVNRVNALLPPDIVNQLRVFAAQIQFRL